MILNSISVVMVISIGNGLGKPSLNSGQSVNPFFLPGMGKVIGEAGPFSLAMVTNLGKDWVIDFNDMSAHLGLFSANMLGNHVPYAVVS